MQNLLSNLNEIQKQAVVNTEGPLLVLAGAGTGKTKTLVSRISYILLNNLARPFEILSVTFTNKAANEMKERINLALSEANSHLTTNDLWIGTFHGMCLRILRKHFNIVGLQDKFTILDQSDSEKAIKQIMSDLNINPKTVPIKVMANAIARLKDKGLMPEGLTSSSISQSSYIQASELISVYKKYQARLKVINSVDFGDLLMLCLEIFKSNNDVLEYYQNKFKYILVDEYQDTNTVQYLLLNTLATKNKNICCVGDDDQSIYSWRGAEVSNILQFSTDYPNSSVLRLEQNYRSTGAILGAASSLIAKNNDRWGKALWTKEASGSKVLIQHCIDGSSEARFICQQVKKITSNDYRYKNIAILVRANYQTREIEDKLIKENIPYKIIGGNKFYERAEVKDAVAYLRLIYQANDDMALLRVINTPRRGVGDVSINKIRSYASTNNLSLFDSIKHLVEQNIFSPKINKELSTLINLINNHRVKAATEPLSKLTNSILEGAGYYDSLRESYSEESKGRLENLNELINSMFNYSNLEEYLEQISLLTDQDRLKQNNEISIITMHGSKGLEFDIVFLPGWEEGIFPSNRSIEEANIKGLEEERRLAYVAITRAKKQAIISHTESRIVFSSLQNNLPSRFIKEIDAAFKDVKKQDVYKSPFIKQAFNHRSTSNTYNSVYENTRPSQTLIAGNRVNHVKFGYGVVKKCLHGQSVVVEFEDFGPQTIMASYLNKV